MPNPNAEFGGLPSGVGAGSGGGGPAFIEEPIFETRRVANPLYDPDAPEFVFDANTEGQAASQIIETPFQRSLRTAQEGTALDLVRALSEGAEDLQPIDLSGLPDLRTDLDLSGLPALPGDVSETRNRAEQAVFDRSMRLLDPQFQQQEERIRQRLADQGIPLGAEAASGNTGALTAFERARQDTLANLANQAVLTGGQEAARDVNLALGIRGAGVGEQVTQAELARAARQLGLGEQQAVRSGTLSELASALGGQFNPTPTGNFFAPGQVDVLGAQGLAQSARNAAFNAASANQQANNQGLFGLGSAAISAAPFLFCSRDYKTNGRPVEQVLPRIDALTVEAWDYRDGIDDGQTHIGPYAEDWQRLFGLGDGKTIHTVDAFGVCLLGIKELSARTRSLDRRLEAAGI